MEAGLKRGWRKQGNQGKDDGSLQKAVAWGYMCKTLGGSSGNSVRLHFLGAPKSLQMVTAAMELKDAYSLEGKL